MRNIPSILINKKRLLLLLFLLTSSPALANCPSGYQEVAAYKTREFRVKWEYEGEYSTCLSINYPEKNNRRQSYGLGSYNRNYQCGKIRLSAFSFGELYVQPSDKSLEPVFFQAPYSEVRNGKIDGVANRQWCEQAGANINCYEEEIWSNRYFPVQILERNAFIYSKDIRRRVKECKIIRF